MKNYNHTSKISILLLTSFFFVSCSNDDSGNTATTIDDDNSGEVSQEEALATARTQTLEFLTSGGEQTWKITNASLETSSGVFDISDNFNVTDDEFVFTSTTLIWNAGNAINTNATTEAETGLDFYVAPDESTIEFQPESGTSLTAIDNRLSFEVVDNQTITAVLTAGSSALGDITLELAPKTASDYKSPPSSGLSFNLITTINGPGIGGDGSCGFIGSYSENSFYVVHRDDTQSDDTGSPERIIKYNLDTGVETENLYYNPDFVTKRLNIIDNELVVFGGNNVNTYPLNPSGDATNTFTHGLQLTRFGFAVQGANGYVVGSNFTVPANSNITRYNYVTNQVDILGELPKARFYGGAEIVNNKLYVFGGRPEFNSDEVDAESFIYNLEDGSIDSFDMPESPTNSYAARFENLIYVAYETRTPAGEPGIFDDDRIINFGVYNTFDDSFIVVSHNLDDSDMFSTVHAITVFNDAIYVIYGSTEEDPVYSIYRASLN